MNLYWKDILDIEGNWMYLHIDISASNAACRIYSGGHKRFKLSKNTDTLFWGTIDQYFGVWFLRNDLFWESNTGIIPPIKSNLIETLKQENKVHNEQYWSRFFAKELSKSEYSFLNNGTWSISKAIINRSVSEKWRVTNLESSFDCQPLSYIQWGITRNSIIIPLKGKPHLQMGRLKWWRKKVREHACPPILVWFVNSLDCFVLIDGHHRLQACLLEQIPPSIYVINEVRKHTYNTDHKALREKALHRIELISKNQKGNQLDVPLINSILTHAYQDFSELRPMTRAIAKSQFETQWIKEVDQFKDLSNINLETFEVMIKNRNARNNQ